MFDRASLARFERVLTVDVAGMNEQAAKRAMAETARLTLRDILDEQRRRAGIAPAHEHAVDGRLGAPYETVRPDGVIVFGFDYLPEIALVGLRELAAASPRVSGAYARGHFLLVNDQPAPADSIRPDDKVVLTNPLPYARRLEVGKKRDGSPFVVQVPPRIYERVGKKLHGIYREVAKITMGYVDLDNAYTLKRAGAKRAQKAGSAIRYPALFIERR